MNNKIKNYLLLPFDFIKVIFQIIIFRFTGKNFKGSGKTLIRLFCVTGGFSNNIISFFTKKRLKKSQLNYSDPKFNLDKINQCLINDGYFIIENFLSKEECENFKKFILNNTLIAKKNGKLISKNILFDEKNPKGSLYEMSDDKIFESEISQNLLFSNFFYNVSKKYFNSLPYFDHMSLAISAKSDKVDVHAAQKFHFDMDRPKWLKFFIYINDVDENNGPHFFIPKTHKNLGIVRDIRLNGYSRIDDNIIDKYYKNIKSIKGKKGTLLIEDTRGLHKGSVVKENYRLIALLQFNNSNFGNEIVKYKINFKNKNNYYFYNKNKESYSNIDEIKLDI